MPTFTMLVLHFIYYIKLQLLFRPLFLLKIVSKTNFHVDGQPQSCAVSFKFIFLVRIWKAGLAMNDEQSHMHVPSHNISTLGVRLSHT